MCLGQVQFNSLEIDGSPIATVTSSVITGAG